MRFPLMPVFSAPVFSGCRMSQTRNASSITDVLSRSSLPLMIDSSTAASRASFAIGPIWSSELP